MKIVYFIFICFFFVDSFSKEVLFHNENQFKDCEKIPAAAEKQVAHVGWPHKISCSLMINEGLVRSVYASTQGNSQAKFYCYIINANNETIFNHSSIFSDLYNDHGIVLPDVQKNDSTKYTIKLEIPEYDKCFIMFINLNITEPLHETCQEFVQRQSFSITFKSNFNQRKNIPCFIPRNVYPKLYIDSNNPNETIQWLHNCGELPSGIQKGTKNNLELKPTSYEDAGVYVCAVVHNGMTKYIMSRRICVQKPQILSRSSMKCDKPSYSSSINGNVTVKCSLEINKRNFYKIVWGKSHSANFTCNSISRNRFSKTPCTYSTTDNSCFMKTPTQQEIESPAYLVSIQLHFIDVNESDFANYSVFATNRFNKDDVIQTTFNLEPEQLK